MESSLLFWVMMMSVLGWRCFGCLEQERHALLTLKANINYPYFDADGELSYWEAESTLSCCEWERVECNNSTGRVTGLSLAGAMTVDVEFVDGSPTWLEDEEVGYFNGSLFLPFEELVIDTRLLDDFFFLFLLSGLSSLKYLYLARNRLEGSNHSDRLSSLSNLEDLYFCGSCLNDNFLQSIGVLASLKVLALSNCCLRGNLPTQGLCELRNLQELDLSGNQLEGALPPCLGNLKDIRVLDLSDNQLTGNIASSPLITLTSLVYLSLSSNHFLVPLSFG
ncbi:hypothetical protein RHGRI_000434 [Rhododendron griersonianum]|uniref:Leucine-rich repeat-containing N-terminal plant-type domain-containing protein n=1 Tax=Rhododendron griersonianum TaxID=479676 RepID=A0AAV6LHM3_9ERIC|nr:hypothetical protein RHGRI_000434 [Rhododendron griersonianum]